MATMTKLQNPLRPNLPPMPASFRKLPVDKRGYPVPFFVDWINGEPEFRAFDPRKMIRCLTERLCWLCGEPLGNRMVAFTIGPMCAINRISSEPPQHPECSEFSAKACPFLSMPKMVRRTSGLPDGVKEAAGIGIKRNPGVTLVWLTRSWTVMREHNGYLFRIGAPIKTLWFAEGRKARRQEVLESIKTGLPILIECAEKDGPDAVLELAAMTAEGMKLVPR